MGRNWPKSSKTPSLATVRLRWLQTSLLPLIAVSIRSIRWDMQTESKSWKKMPHCSIVLILIKQIRLQMNLVSPEDKKILARLLLIREPDNQLLRSQKAPSSPPFAIQSASQKRPSRQVCQTLAWVVARRLWQLAAIISKDDRLAAELALRSVEGAWPAYVRLMTIWMITIAMMILKTPC